MTDRAPPADSEARDELLAGLADDFLRRHRAGERPGFEEYCAAHGELAPEPPAGPGDTSAALCAHLTGHLTRPSLAAVRAEVRARLAGALDAMEPTDREVLALRHFEQLSNAEAAQVLGIQERAAAKRYLRALGRLKELLSEMPGGLTELRP